MNINPTTNIKPTTAPVGADRRDDIVIDAEGVRRTYGSNTALAGVDLEVRRGEIVAVLGPNGAGKTTLVEILEGLRRRDAGTVTVLGTDPARADRAWRARIGAVMQLGTETDELTAAEMLRAQAAYYPTSLPVTDLVAVLDLEGLESRRVFRQLSGGQRRRLDIALGLIGDPELVFLDEPTTGLDAEIRRSIWDLIRRLADRGMTVTLTTHYLDEVEHLADRTVVLVDGTVVWSGTTADLRSDGVSDTVTFALLAPLGIADLPADISMKARSAGGGRVAVDAIDTTGVVSQLMGWASTLDGPNPVLSLEIGRPNLEDAYLTLLETTNSSRESTR